MWRRRLPAWKFVGCQVGGGNLAGAVPHRLRAPQKLRRRAPRRPVHPGCPTCRNSFNVDIRATLSGMGIRCSRSGGRGSQRMPTTVGHSQARSAASVSQNLAGAVVRATSLGQHRRAQAASESATACSGATAISVGLGACRLPVCPSSGRSEASSHECVHGACERHVGRV